MKRLALVAISLSGCMFWQGCGEGSRTSTQPPPQTPPPPPVSITVSVTPQVPAMDQGGTVPFTAVVNGTNDQRVTWAVATGGNSGTISQDGVYTAPGKSGTFEVIATSMADPTKTGIGTVYVNDVSVFVDPLIDAVPAGSTRQFTASVFGTLLDTNVTWHVQGGSGTISSTGLYTAPVSGGGPYTVTATSTADPTRSGSGRVWAETRDFQLLGGMVLERVNHTATVLPSGDVLLAGGAGQAGSPDPGAEIFEAASNTFRATGAMSEVRFGHTATMLNNGKVLITGGRNGADTCSQCSTNTAELYDPTTETFSATGTMATPRSFHTAVLLQDGKVLVSGGASNTDVSSNSVEIYDPGTGQFSTTGPMSANRARHTATLLSNGRVLIAGGEGTSINPFTAEIYDTSAGTSTQIRIAPKSRNAHSATLLPNGNVLMGGGGVEPYYVYSQSRVVNPTNNTVSSDITTITPRMFHSATLLDPVNGKVLLVGGKSGSDASISSAELFEDGAFRPVLSTRKARSGHAATMLVSGKVLITGGAGDRSAEIY